MYFDQPVHYKFLIQCSSEVVVCSSGCILGADKENVYFRGGLLQDLDVWVGVEWHPQLIHLPATCGAHHHQPVPMVWCAEQLSFTVAVHTLVELHYFTDIFGPNYQQSNFLLIVNAPTPGNKLIYLLASMLLKELIEIL